MTCFVVVSGAPFLATTPPATVQTAPLLSVRLVAGGIVAAPLEPPEELEDELDELELLELLLDDDELDDDELLELDDEMVAQLVAVQV